MKLPVDRRRLMSLFAASSLISPAQTTNTPQSPTNSLPPDGGLFKGFEAKRVHTRGADIFLRHGGTGAPLLLLHGNPQTLACWHKTAGPLSKRFHIVMADLRGYGDSVGPRDGGAKHINYSFRTMAQDQIDVMASLGYSRFFVAGHDRGARTAHLRLRDAQVRVRLRHHFCDSGTENLRN